MVARKDIIIMSRKESKKLNIIKQVIAKKLIWKDASEFLEASMRQIARMVIRVKLFGDDGIIHRSRGKPSNRRCNEKEEILKLYKTKYEDFGPTLASEKLFEINKIKISDETLRKWLATDHEVKCVWQRKGRKHRKWRERKTHCGEMVQMDGSHHDWFEGRGPECCLMGYIDDATSRMFARFYAYEGTIPAMDSFRKYIRENGIPHSLYADRHTTYRSTGKLSIEDELAGKAKPQTQFERAVSELGVKIIPAYSPQAKGRIERQFRTFQDRVIKEMRLKGISSIEEANEFLENYLPVYNKRFSVVPKEKADLHRPVSKGAQLDRILCIKTKHVLRNDYTIAHESKLYQVDEHTKCKKVLVEDRINGAMKIYGGKKSLKYKQITEIPKKQLQQEKQLKEPLISSPKKKHIPPKNHPWRNFTFGKGLKQPEVLKQNYAQY